MNRLLTPRSCTARGPRGSYSADRSAGILWCAALACALSANPGDARAKPLQVFILAGQSNMQGHAEIATFDYLADDPATATLLAQMRGPDGAPQVLDRIWISSVGCAGDGHSDVIEQQGGSDALKEKTERVKGIAKGQGSVSEKAKAAAQVAREKPKPEDQGR